MKIKSAAFCFFLFFLYLLNSPCFAREIAIVVNKANPVENLSLAQLKAIFKAERQFWDGEKIHILMREENSWEKELILKKVYETPNEELNKFWLGKVFRGEISTFPAVIGSVTMLKKLIANMVGAISFCDIQVLDDKEKVIRIEGKLPQEPGYPLSEQ